MKSEIGNIKTAAAAERFTRERDYWLNRLSGDLEKTCFPYDFQHTGTQPDARKMKPVSFGFTGELCSRLIKLSNRFDPRLHVILVTGLVLLLNKYTGNCDVIVGSPIYRQDMEGELINTVLALRNRLENGMTFKQLLLQVNETIIEAVDHQNYPIELLVKKLNLPEETGGFSLFDAAILLENSHDEKYLDHIKHNMTFCFLRTGEVIGGQVKYDSSLYHEDTIRRIAIHFTHLLELAAAGVETPIADIEMLPAEEKHKLLVEFNDTQAEYPWEKTLHELFEEQVERTPDHIALVEGKEEAKKEEGPFGRVNAFGGGHLSYRELNKKSNRLAHLLIEKGTGPGAVVGIMIDRSLEMVIGLMAILKAGGAYLPIYPGLPPQRVLFMLKYSGARILSTDSHSLKDISFTQLQGFEENGDIGLHITAPRPPIADFDGLPVPDRQHIDLRSYKHKIGMASVTDCISIQTTRGCPYECLYCHKIWSKKHMHRSAEKIYGEIEYFYKNRVANFAVIDDCFNLNTRESRNLFHSIIKNKMKIQIFFPNGLRGDIMTPDYIDLMVEAGTRGINLSLETASPRLQKLLRKNLDLEKFKKVIDYIASHYPNVILELATMHGFPGETEEEAMMTLDFIKGVRWLHFPYIHILKIFPNTEMEAFALEHGISKAGIMKSKDRAFHELPETLPFPKSFTRKYQSDFLNSYFLDKERLTHVLPYQMKVLSEEALTQKYNAYLPVAIGSIDDIVKVAQLDNLEIPGGYRGGVETGKTIFDREFQAMAPKPGAMKILFLDLSQHFSSHRMLYRVVEQPLGALYLLTHLKARFGDLIDGRIYKSGNDFDSFEELRSLAETYNPDLVGIRTLTFFKEFFHETVSLLRQWGLKAPIITGGPYASSDYDTILKDKHVDLAVLGEGEETLSQLIEEMLANGFKLPGPGVLNQIGGIAFAEDHVDSLDSAASGASVDSCASQSIREVILLDQMAGVLAKQEPANPGAGPSSDNLAYVMYTSGSTGRPRGVMVEHRQVNNCIHWMQDKFRPEPTGQVVQRTNLSFDPSVWEIFWPLAVGASVRIIGDPQARDAEFLLRLMAESREVTVMYCPATLVTAMSYLLESRPVKPLLRLPLLIIGAEPITRETVETFYSYFKGKIVNTYGPTEGTINNTYYRLEPGDRRSVVPIGKPVANNRIYILDGNLHPVPLKVTGEICIAGHSVARGYISDRKRTEECFIDNPFGEGKLYKTGDMGRWLEDGNIEIKGRIDDQVKIRGYRIEPGEIENALLKHEAVGACLVVAKTVEELKEKTRECNACGIWSNYPGVTINNEGVCNLCENFNRYKQLIHQYFKTPRELESKLREKNKDKQSKYDCLLVYACERVATYALYKLVEMGLNVLSATYDSGHYDQASLDRIKEITAKIGVDHIFLEHQRSNEIMKESLRVAKTMCKGCIHTSSSLAGEYAYKNDIKFVIGETLSRGQIVENKLYKFVDMGINDAAELEREIAKLQKNAALIDKKIFDIIDIQVVTDGSIYDKVEFIDFYRYFNVTNEEMIRFLDSKDPYWKNLETTAIYSTDCKICQVGNFYHLKEKGYHYTGSAKSWDQRLGLTTRKALKEDLTIGLTARGHAEFLDKLGYREPQALETHRKYICAYIVPVEGQVLPPLREYLSGKIPGYMIPYYFIPLKEFPLTSNGKIDRKALPNPERFHPEPGDTYVAPKTAVEKLIARIWKEILHVELVGTQDNFFDIGGSSLDIIIVGSKLKDALKKEIPVVSLFTYPTVSTLAGHLAPGEREEKPSQSESQRDDIREKGRKRVLQRRTV